MKYVLGLIVEHKVKALMVSLTVGVLLVGFQNCSKVSSVQMSDMASNSKVGASGSNAPSSIDTNELPPGSSVQVQQPGADDNDGPMNYQVQPPQPGDSPKSAPQAVQQQQQESGDSSSVTQSSVPSDDGSSSPSVPPAPPAPSAPAGDSGGSNSQASAPPADPPPAVSPPADDSSGPISSGEACQAVIDCNNYKVSSNANSDYRGKGILNPSDFDNKSNVDVISDMKGKHVLCDLEVNHLVHSNGKLILVRSHVKDLASFGGNVRVVSDDDCKPAISKIPSGDGHNEKKGDGDNDDQGQNNNSQGNGKRK
ncbi:MAG: hypothetical protein ACXVAX_01665 [Pseudobdellovibrio sp.]